VYRTTALLAVSLLCEFYRKGCLSLCQVTFHFIFHHFSYSNVEISTYLENFHVFCFVEIFVYFGEICVTFYEIQLIE